MFVDSYKVVKTLFSYCSEASLFLLHEDPKEQISHIY